MDLSWRHLLDLDDNAMDCRDNAFKAILEIGVPESKHSEATRAKPFVTPCIPFGRLNRAVTIPVQLNRKPEFRAEEIKHVWPSRMLPAKAGA